MRIVFIGATKLSLACLESMPSGIEVCGIITAPRQFRISYSADKVTNIRHADLKAFGMERGIPVFEMQNDMNEQRLLKHLESWRPHFILVIGWYHMIPKKVREMAPMGTAGIHASLLPRYSGGAPLVWAMINQEIETGITFFCLADGVDNGDIIAQKKFSIDSADTIADLLEKAEHASKAVLKTHLPLIAEGRAGRFPQDESARTLFPQRSPADGKIWWDRPAGALYSFIRAQTKPYPGAFGLFNDEKLILWGATPISVSSKEPPGTVVTVDAQERRLYIQVGAYEGLAVQTVYWRGEDMDVRRFIRNCGIRVGDKIS